MNLQKLLFVRTFKFQSAPEKLSHTIEQLCAAKLPSKSIVSAHSADENAAGKQPTTAERAHASALDNKFRCCDPALFCRLLEPGCKREVANCDMPRISGLIVLLE